MPNKKNKILVSGSLAYDKIMNFSGNFGDHILADKIHNINVSFLVGEIKENFGGTAGNIAYNLALLGEEPIILASAGKDFSPYEKWLAKNQVNLSQVKINNQELTAFANIITDQKDNQITAFYPGAMKEKNNFNLSNLENIKLAIISPGNADEMLSLAKYYQANNISYIFDPGQQIPALNPNDLKNLIFGAKVLIANDYEIALILEKTKLSEEIILENVEILVTTLGEKGSLIKTKNELIKVAPAKPQNTCDPTGAGDAYRAGFIYGLINNWPLEKTGKLAGLVACYTVEKYGTQTHSFSLEELALRYKNNFQENLI